MGGQGRKFALGSPFTRQEEGGGGELTFSKTDLMAKVDPKELKLSASFLQNWSIVLLLSVRMH